MSKMVEQERRLENFEYLMKVLDGAEGVRDTEFGAFSFLWEGSYVRKVVVTPRIKTSIAGLKTFLATEVLEIFGANNKSKVSYKDIQDQLSGDMSKKYRFSFELLDDVFDVEKNKEAFMERCWLFPDERNMQEQIRNADILFPYLFMDRLREVVWKKLRNFFRLCEQETCNECKKKSEAYFQFIQAVALYEIFIIEFVKEKGSVYIENAMALVKELEAEAESIGSQGASLGKYTEEQKEKLVSKMHDILSGMNAVTVKQIEKLCQLVGYVLMFQMLTADFGISYNAMCYLLMVFEAMNVCGENMRGIKKVSLKIMDELADNYEKDLVVLQNYNKKREKRYKKVNEKLEELLEKYGDEKYDESVVIVAFMEELCKPVSTRDMRVIRGLECKLGRPIYRDLGGKEQVEIT